MCFVYWQLTLFSTAYKIFTCHTIFETWLSETPNLQNHTLIIGLWLSLQFQTLQKHFLQNTTHNSLCNAHKSKRNSYYGRGVFTCLPLRCVCDILNAVLHFARDVRHFLCAVLGFVCKVLKKRGKVLKMCVKQLKKKRPLQPNTDKECMTSKFQPTLRNV